MQADGKGWLFAPKGLVDGPLPTHYEPQESPVPNPLYRQQANPTRQVFTRKDNLIEPVRRRRRAPTSSRSCSPRTGSPSTTPPAG